MNEEDDNYMNSLAQATLIIKGFMQRMSGIEINELVWSYFPEITPDDREHAWNNASKMEVLVSKDKP